MSCTHNCQQGRTCTCRDLPAPTQPLGGDTPETGSWAAWLPLLGLALVVWLAAALLAPLLAGWLYGH